MTIEESQIVIILDLADENPVPPDRLAHLIPPREGQRVYKLSDFGAKSASRGSNPRRWRSWTNAVNQLLARAREESQASGSEVHYYVAGRAGLPVWAYVGYRLSKWAGRVSCVQYRDDTHEWQLLPMKGSGGKTERFFNRASGLEPGGPRREGKVAVFISTSYSMDPAKIVAFASTTGCRLAGTVELRPDTGDPLEPVRWLSEENSITAAQELAKALIAVSNAYSSHDGLILFVAGPGSLALMVGLATNLNRDRVVWLPNYTDGTYEPAIEIPRGRGDEVRMVLASANPRDQRWLNVGGELRSLRGELRSSSNQSALSIRDCSSATIDSLHREMLEFRPHILHFSGHGEQSATIFQDDEGYAHQVPAQAFLDLLEATDEASLDLVFLNSCESSEQAKSLTRFVDCAIGMTEKIDDQVAGELSRVFYCALAAGRTIQNAYDQMSAMVAAKHLGHEDYLAIHAREGVRLDEIVIVVSRRSRG